MTFFYVTLGILGLAFLITLGIFIYLFFFTFYRRENDFDNLYAPINDFLGDYKPTVKIGMDFAEECKKCEVSINSFDNIRLVADYYKNGNSNNTIILFHGYRSSPRRDFSCAIKMYYEMGLNVLLVDQRAHYRSGGHLITFGEKERLDAVAWVEYVVATFGKDTNIFLDGLSMGGTTVLLASELELPENIKGIIADCGFESAHSIIKRVSQKYYRIDSELVLKILDIFCRIFGRFSIYSHSTVKALGNTNIPIFISHGKCDELVPYEMSIQAYEAAKGEKKIFLSETAGHGMSYLHDTDALVRELRLFISSHIV